MSEARSRLVRQWTLVRAIAERKRGLSIAQLVELTESSKATVYRDLTVLREAGVPLASEKVNGEARHRLLGGAELPPLTLRPLQVVALQLARQGLELLASTGVVAELDALLAKLRAPEQRPRLALARAGAGRREVVAKLDQALAQKCRVQMEYRAASRGGRARSVQVEPLLLNVVGGDPYLRGYCVEQQEERTYKIARIERVELTAERSTYRPLAPPSEAFKHAVKAWSGDLTTVRVRLKAEVAWRAAEYPLVPDQKLIAEGDGAVIVQAQVSGVVEASRWVLAWGAAAEALDPPELRAAVRSELARALSNYHGPGPTKVRGRKSTALETDRRSHAESRRA